MLRNLKKDQVLNVVEGGEVGLKKVYSMLFFFFFFLRQFAMLAKTGVNS
jgi:hypothetical protein